MKYSPAEIEPRWQRRWDEAGLYLARDDFSTPKSYCLEYFPYPSGDGLSVGHCRNYVPVDVISRYLRMRGRNVLYPMGWDAFGLPAENRAMEEGIHPRVTVRQNTDNYRRQLRLIGSSYDWSREIDSSSTDFYRWTQWFFLLLHRRGLAYRATGEQWWCPSCRTILANEEVTLGRCWRCESEVVRKSLPQWYFRITAYADRLLDDLALVDWPEGTVRQQRSWIGRAEGAELDFVAATGERIAVFTTRADTVFGATFVALAPEHALVDALVSAGQRDAVRAYVERARRANELERIAEQREPDGVELGAWCAHPFTGERLPVWVADYVLPTHGTGAIMGVPAHDARDHAFARRYGLRVRAVDATDSAEARQRIVADAQMRGAGRARVAYRLRDWIISRQRYWGAPIPIVYCGRCGTVPVPERDLPVLLPDVSNYRPSGDGRSPLAVIPEFVNTRCPSCGGPAERETDTMGGFACSSWYFLRFADPRNEREPFDPEKVRYWLPVDLYVGGSEHATLHLIYARFWTKVMHDAGLVDFVEPFAKLRHQGQVLAADGRRMSKSRKNVITPDEIVARHGADALRAYELFIAPFEQDVAWSEHGISGVSRWLHRVWALIGGSRAVRDAGPLDPDTGRALRRAMHRAIRRVTADIEALRFNTAVAALMEYTNALVRSFAPERVSAQAWDEAVDALLLLLAPICPHIAEELWMRRGRPFSIQQQRWPEWDPELARDEMVTIALQLDGRTRARITVPAGEDVDALREVALADERVRAALDGASIARVVVVADRLVNVVTERR